MEWTASRRDPGIVPGILDSGLQSHYVPRHNLGNNMYPCITQAKILGEGKGMEKVMSSV